MFRRPPRPPRTGPLLPYPTLFRSMAYLRIVPGALTLAHLRRLYRTRPALELDPASRAAIADSAATVARVIASGEVVYGVNTGFGKLAQTTIPTDRLAELQRELVRSHCAGVGDPPADHVVFLVLALTAHGGRTSGGWGQ